MGPACQSLEEKTSEIYIYGHGPAPQVSDRSKDYTMSWDNYSCDILTNNLIASCLCSACPEGLDRIKFEYDRLLHG